MRLGYRALRVPFLVQELTGWTTLGTKTSLDQVPHLENGVQTTRTLFHKLLHISDVSVCERLVQVTIVCY